MLNLSKYSVLESVDEDSLLMVYKVISKDDISSESFNENNYPSFATKEEAWMSVFEQYIDRDLIKEIVLKDDTISIILVEQENDSDEEEDET